MPALDQRPEETGTDEGKRIVDAAYKSVGNIVVGIPVIAMLVVRIDDGSDVVRILVQRVAVGVENNRFRFFERRSAVTCNPL